MRSTCPDTAGPKYFVLLKLLLDVVRIVFHTPALATSTENALLVKVKESQTLLRNAKSDLSLREIAHKNAMQKAKQDSDVKEKSLRKQIFT